MWAYASEFVRLGMNVSVPPVGVEKLRLKASGRCIVPHK